MTADFHVNLLLSTGESPSDWLGLSQIGSPDSTPRDANDAAAAEKPSTVAARKDVRRQLEPSAGPPAASARQTSTSGGVPKADKGDSRRGSLFDDKAQKSSLDWLEMATDRSTAGGRKSLDIADHDDRLGTKTWPMTEKADSVSDYLGLGPEIDITHKQPRL